MQSKHLMHVLFKLL